MPQTLQSRNSNPTDIKKVVEVSYSFKSGVKEKKSKNDKNQVLPETFPSQKVLLDHELLVLQIIHGHTNHVSHLPFIFITIM